MPEGFKVVGRGCNILVVWWMREVWCRRSEVVGRVLVGQFGAVFGVWAGQSGAGQEG